MQFLYVGNWSYKENEPESGFGIKVFDPQTALAVPVSKILEGETDRAFACNRVGAACFHPIKKDVLYFVDESTSSDGSGWGGSAVIAVKLDKETGAMQEINRQLTFAPLPSYCCVNQNGTYLIVTNHSHIRSVTHAVKGNDGKYRAELIYDDSSAVLYPLSEDGSIGEAVDVYLFEGSGPNPSQCHPHPHIVKMSPDGKFFAVCDRGNDKVSLFRIDYEEKKLKLTGECTMPAGNEPRYCVFHPSLPYLTINNEAAATLSAFSYSPEGTLKYLGDASVLPEGVTLEKCMQSDFKNSADGRYLYTLLRGNNSISVLEMDEATGIPHMIQNIAMDGTNPKGCALTPDGRHLLVAAKGSGNVEIYAVGKDGKLENTGRKFEEANPATFSFFNPEQA